MKLVVVFTRGMSLRGWEAAGILERELSLLRAMRQVVDQLVLVTYGDDSETAFAAQLPGVAILPNRWPLSANAYSVLAPWLHRRALRDTSVFRTNQINGSWTAVIARALHGGTLIVRCGFLWSDGVARTGAAWWRRTIAQRLERLAMRAADLVVVAGPADSQTVIERYRLPPSRVAVIPNFVDTATFAPDEAGASEARRVIFVGRLETEKNAAVLVDAVADLPGVTLTIVGDGSLRSSLEQRARERGARVEFVGRIPHARVPDMLRSAAVLVMPSLYEGNPKALLEAMACGVPVVGTRVPGIRDVIEPGVNGVLCGTTAAEIRDAVASLLDDTALRSRLRAGGRAYVAQRCSLTSVVAAERELLARFA